MNISVFISIRDDRSSGKDDSFVTRDLIVHYLKGKNTDIPEQERDEGDNVHRRLEIFFIM